MALLRFFLTIIIVLPFVFSKNETIPDIMNNFLASFPDIQLQALVQKVNQSMPIIENLLDHSNLMVDLANVTVEKNGRTWNYGNLCYRLPLPNAIKQGEGALGLVVDRLFENLSPCMYMSPLDCFWDGAKAMGPFPPIDPGRAAALLFPQLKNYAASQGLSWKKINLKTLVGERQNLSLSANISSDDVFDMFADAVGESFQTRACLDPVEADCPQSAPNKFDICQAVQKFESWKTKQGQPVKVSATDPASIASDFFSLFESEAQKRCRLLAPQVRDFIKNSANKVKEFLPDPASRPQPPDNVVKDMLANGCSGIIGKIMNLPRELIFDEAVKSGAPNNVDNFRSIMLLTSAQGLYERYKDSNLPNWNIQAAQEVLDAWRANAKKILPAEAFLDTSVSDRIPGTVVEKIMPIVNKVKEFIQLLNKL